MDWSTDPYLLVRLEFLSELNFKKETRICVLDVVKLSK